MEDTAVMKKNMGKTTQGTTASSAFTVKGSLDVRRTWREKQEEEVTIGGAYLE